MHHEAEGFMTASRSVRAFGSDEGQPDAAQGVEADARSVGDRLLEAAYEEGQEIEDIPSRRVRPAASPQGRAAKMPGAGDGDGSSDRDIPSRQVRPAASPQGRAARMPGAGYGDESSDGDIPVRQVRPAALPQRHAARMPREGHGDGS